MATAISRAHPPPHSPDCLQEVTGFGGAGLPPGESMCGRGGAQNAWADAGVATVVRGTSTPATTGWTCLGDARRWRHSTCAQQPPIDTTARSQTWPAVALPQLGGDPPASCLVCMRRWEPDAPGRWHFTCFRELSMARDAALKAGPGQTTAAGLAGQSVRLRLRYLDTGCHPSMALCDTTPSVPVMIQSSATGCPRHRACVFLVDDGRPYYPALFPQQTETNSPLQPASGPPEWPFRPAPEKILIN